MGIFRVEYRGVFWLSLVLALFSLPVYAAERIHEFRSKITIESKGDVVVEETIRVNAEHKEINRGIYRDFSLPSSGMLVVDEVWRNDMPEAFHILPTETGLRVYIGEKRHMVPVGDHSIRLCYTLRGVFEKVDAVLEWKLEATGRGWIFPINEVLLQINAEDMDWLSAMEIAVFAHSKEGEFLLEPITKNDYQYWDGDGFLPGEGVQVVIQLPQSLVVGQLPTPWERRMNAWSIGWGGGGEIRSGWNGTLLRFSGITLGGVFIYFLLAWVWVGRDPMKGYVKPRHGLPEELSPAVVRYMMNRKYDLKTFSVALVNLAHLGDLKLTRKGDEFKIEDTRKKGKPVNKEHRLVYKHLELSVGDSMLMSGWYATEFKLANEALEKYLVKNCVGRYFKQNRLLWWIGMALSVRVYTAGVDSGNGEGLFANFVLASLVFWGLTGLFILFMDTVHKYSNSRKVRWGVWMITGLIVVCVIGISSLLVFHQSLVYVLFISVLALNGALFYQLLPALRRDGRKIMNTIEGYRLYLKECIKKVEESVGTPKEQASLMSDHLPYIIAMDLDGGWIDQLMVSLQEGLSGEDWKRFRRIGCVGLWDLNRGWMFYLDFTNCVNHACTPQSKHLSDGKGFSGGDGFGAGSGGGGW